MITMPWLLWLIVLAAGIHVAEEYYYDWVGFVRKTSFSVNIRQFWVFNLLFIALAIIGALVGTRFIILGMSVAALIFINALIHIFGTLFWKKVMPGLFSAVLFYLPLAIYTYAYYTYNGFLSIKQMGLSFLLGFCWMVAPIIYQAQRLNWAEKKALLTKLIHARPRV